MPTEYVRDSSGTYTLVRQADPNACGLAAVAATILARMFMCPIQPPTEQSLLAQLGGTLPQGGLRRSELERLLTLNNIPFEERTYGKVEDFRPALKAKIAQRKPAILHVMRGTAANYAGHWVTAVSTRDDTLVVLDPMFGLQTILFEWLPSYPYVNRSNGDTAAASVVFSGQCLFTT